MTATTEQFALATVDAVHEAEGAAHDVMRALLEAPAPTQSPAPAPAPAPAPTPAPPANGDMAWSFVARTQTPQAIPPQAGPDGSKYQMLLLHGSGASGLGQTDKDGDWWEAECSGKYADPLDAVGTFLGMSAREASDNDKGITFRPLEHHKRSNGATAHQYWVGRTAGPGAPLEMIGTRRMLRLIEQMAALYPQIDPAKLWVSGVSMGAWAVGQIFKASKSRVAMIFLDMPRFRYARRATPPQLEFIDWTASPNVPTSVPFGSGPQLHPVDGGGPCEPFFDMVAHAAAGKPMPPLMWVGSTGDAYTSEDNDASMIQAMRDGGQWLACAWGPGIHGARPSPYSVWPSYGHHAFKADCTLPLFTHSSRDAPLTAESGGVNLGFSFRNIVETQGAWSCEVVNVLEGRTEVMVSPWNVKVYQGDKTAKGLILQQGVWQKVSFA